MIASAVLVILSGGCGSTPPPEPPGQAAPRIFAVAERLDKERKTRQAFAAYRQVMEAFPDSSEAKKAGERIRLFQKQALVKRR